MLSLFTKSRLLFFRVSQILSFAHSNPTADFALASAARSSSVAVASCSPCRSCHLGQVDLGVGRVLV